VVAAAVATVVALIAGGVWVYRSPFLTIETVAVDGASRLADADVLESAALLADETLLRLRPRRVESRLEQNPWIAEATVRRELPDTVRIAVVERSPAAAVVVEGEQWLVAEDGVFLEQRSEEDTASYVLVEEIADLAPRAGSPSGSTELNNAIAALDGLSDELRQQVQSVVAPTIDKTVLRTKDGVEIFVGEAQEMPVKDEIARRILAEQEGVVYINVRTIDRPTWRGLDE
jgi:cell division protein FtsQ